MSKNNKCIMNGISNALLDGKLISDTIKELKLKVDTTGEKIGNWLSNDNQSFVFKQDSNLAKFISLHLSKNGHIKVIDTDGKLVDNEDFSVEAQIHNSQVEFAGIFRNIENYLLKQVEEGKIVEGKKIKKSDFKGLIDKTEAKYYENISLANSKIKDKYKDSFELIKKQEIDSIVNQRLKDKKVLIENKSKVEIIDDIVSGKITDKFLDKEGKEIIINGKKVNEKIKEDIDTIKNDKKNKLSDETINKRIYDTYKNYISENYLKKKVEIYRKDIESKIIEKNIEKLNNKAFRLSKEKVFSSENLFNGIEHKEIIEELHNYTTKLIEEAKTTTFQKNINNIDKIDKENKIKIIDEIIDGKLELEPKLKNKIVEEYNSMNKVEYDKNINKMYSYIENLIKETNLLEKYKDKKIKSLSSYEGKTKSEIVEDTISGKLELEPELKEKIIEEYNYLKNKNTESIKNKLFNNNKENLKGVKIDINEDKFISNYKGYSQYGHNNFLVNDLSKIPNKVLVEKVGNSVNVYPKYIIDKDTKELRLQNEAELKIEKDIIVEEIVKDISINGGSGLNKYADNISFDLLIKEKIIAQDLIQNSKILFEDTIGNITMFKNFGFTSKQQTDEFFNSLKYNIMKESKVKEIEIKRDGVKEKQKIDTQITEKNANDIIQALRNQFDIVFKDYGRENNLGTFNDITSSVKSAIFSSNTATMTQTSFGSEFFTIAAKAGWGNMFEGIMKDLDNVMKEAKEGDLAAQSFLDFAEDFQRLDIFENKHIDNAYYDIKAQKDNFGVKDTYGTKVKNFLNGVSNFSMKWSGLRRLTMKLKLASYHAHFSILKDIVRNGKETDLSGLGFRKDTVDFLNNEQNKILLQNNNWKIPMKKEIQQDIQFFLKKSTDETVITGNELLDPYEILGANYRNIKENAVLNPTLMFTGYLVKAQNGVATTLLKGNKWESIASMMVATGFTMTLIQEIRENIKRGLKGEKLKTYDEKELKELMIKFAINVITQSAATTTFGLAVSKISTAIGKENLGISGREFSPKGVIGALGGPVYGNIQDKSSNIISNLADLDFADSGEETLKALTDLSPLGAIPFLKDAIKEVPGWMGYKN